MIDVIAWGIVAIGLIACAWLLGLAMGAEYTLAARENVERARAQA